MRFVGVMIDAGRTLCRALCKFRATPRTILGKIQISSISCADGHKTRGQLALKSYMWV